MSIDSHARFEIALTAWTLNPVVITQASAPLANVSQSLHQTQQAVEPMFEAYRDSGTILPPPVGEAWYDAMSFIVGRNIRQLRRHLHSGRNQVAARELLAQAEGFKAAWDAYRSVTER